jgi:hypothetical protein
MALRLAPRLPSLPTCYVSSSEWPVEFTGDLETRCAASPLHCPIREREATGSEGVASVPAAVDLSVFEDTRHSPPFLSLARALPGRPLCDFCVPVNPYFPTPEMFALFRERLEEVLKYYPSSSADISRALAAALDLDADAVVVANGSTELLTWIDVLLVRSSLATPVPTFGRWTDHPLELGKQLFAYPLRCENNFRLDVADFVGFVRECGARAVAVCNPNNPTGALAPRDDVIALLGGRLDVVVVDDRSWTSPTSAVPTVQPRPSAATTSSSSEPGEKFRPAASGPDMPSPTARGPAPAIPATGTSTAWRNC